MEVTREIPGDWRSRTPDLGSFGGNNPNWVDNSNEALAAAEQWAHLKIHRYRQIDRRFISFVVDFKFAGSKTNSSI